MSEVLTSYEKELADTAMPAGKKKVLLAAIHLFARQGFAATTTAQIAKKAGVSEGTIYKYFSSKSKLLNQLLLPLLKQIRDNFFTKLDTSKSLDEFIDFAIKDRLSFAMENFDLIKILLQELMTNSEQLAALSAITNGNNGVFQQIDQIKDHYSEINPNLSHIQFIRIVLSPPLAYLCQCQLFGNKPKDQTMDLRIIHQQILAGLTK